MEFNATFLISAISFILFTFVMNKIFYAPIGKIIVERQNFIDETLSDAKFSSDKANSIMKDRDEKLNSALLEAKQIIAENTNNAKSKAADIIKIAKQSSVEKIAKAKDDMYEQADILNKNLDSQVNRLAGVISSKLLKIEGN